MSAMFPLVVTHDRQKKSFRQKSLTLIVVCLVVLGWLHAHGRALKRTAMYNGRIQLKRAYTNYQATGNLPQPFGTLNPIPFIAFTNTVTLDGTNHQCALGVDWFPRHGLLVITTNHATLWLDNKRGPKLVDDKYQAPLFSLGI
jgi:hypothetical protein